MLLEKVYCRHQQGSDIADTFKDKYGSFIPNYPLEDKPYNAQELISQLERMKDSAAGFDG